MSDLIGYVSSFFVTFGLSVGFFIGGLIFVFGITYGIMLLFKKFRRLIREDEVKPFVGIRNRMVPVRSAPKHRGPNSWTSNR